jgi:chloride channel 3/4/5
MFELTGALTYILPTMVNSLSVSALCKHVLIISSHQIVLLVTKAVGDFLGTNGIADEMIRFNGYPFLETEDHAFNISVSNVMKKDLHTLPASGMRVCDLEETLDSTKVKGFPIISPESLILQGYIGRTELCYVLGKCMRCCCRMNPSIDHSTDNAKELGDISPDTPCSFMRDTTDQGVPGLADSAPGQAIGIEEDVAEEIIGTTVSSDVLKFWPWVNQVIHGMAITLMATSLTPRLVDTSHSVSAAAIRNSYTVV